MLVAVISLTSSPGVTTFSLALAARWPDEARCVLVECDPSGGDVATRFSLSSSPGVVSLAAAARRSTDPGLLWQHTQTLPGGLPVVTAPPGADHARAALSALAPERPSEAGVLRLAADAPEAVVIADCGRVDPGSPALPILGSADAMLLLTGAHADQLAHVASRLTTVGRWSRRPALLLVGEGHSTDEVARELGVPAMGRIPEDRRGAAMLCGRPSRRRGPSRSALGRTAGNVARVLLAQQPPPRPAPTPAQPGEATSRPAPLLRAVPDGADPSETEQRLRVGPPAAPGSDDTSRNGTEP
jgi:hypothetical protein